MKKSPRFSIDIPRSAAAIMLDKEASRVSPESWGDTRRDPLLTINIQDQHLGALRELSIEQDAIEHDDVTDDDE